MNRLRRSGTVCPFSLFPSQSVQPVGMFVVDPLHIIIAPVGTPVGVSPVSVPLLFLRYWPSESVPGFVSVIVMSDEFWMFDMSVVSASCPVCCVPLGVC